MTDQPDLTHPCPFGCGKMFRTAAGAARHQADKHNPLRIVTSYERPKNRGPFACGVTGCGYSFANESGAAQHRRDKHGIAPAPMIETSFDDRE